MRRKTLMLESLFNKFAGLQADSFITKGLQHRCFSVKIAKFLKTSILKDICERLILNFIDSKWKRRIQRKKQRSKKHGKNRDVFRDGNWRRIQNPVKHLR